MKGSRLRAAAAPARCGDGQAAGHSAGALAIGPGREIHLHLNVSAAELAAILRHHTEEK
jgi:hypothetical protein